MGNSQSTSLLTALQDLLGQRKLKFERKILSGFLDECDRCAPWFLVSGSLTLQAWDKLGEDLDREAESGKLKPGTRPLWRMVRACLEDKRCKDVIRASQKILAEHQESMSESDTGFHKEKKNKGDKQARVKLETKRREDQASNKLYPSLKNLTLEASDDSELSEDNADLEEEAAQYKRERYDLDEPCTNVAWKEDIQLRKKAVTPTAPPFNPQYRDMMKPTKGNSSCPEVWREMGLSFPIFLDANGQHYHEPIDFKTIKQLAESVKTYGVSAAFVMAQLEAISRYCLTPEDWRNLAKACLSSGQYLDWRSYLFEYANAQAAINLASGVDPQKFWDADMLLGLGRFAVNQLGYPEEVYRQIGDIVIKAWRALPN